MAFPCGDDAGDPAPPTFVEPDHPVSGMAAPDPRGAPIELPPSLAHRFRTRERLPRQEERTVHRVAEEGRSAELRAAVFRVGGREPGTAEPERIVKWYHPDAAPDPEVTRRLSRPLHPGLSYVPEAGADRGAPFHVLPSHGNTDLATQLRGHAGPLPSDAVRALVVRVHGALTALHEAGVVHRDVKPSNLVLTEYGRPGSVVLIDFGISLADSPRDTGGGWAGTPGYMSPQAQLRIQTVRPQDDWWSFGIVVAEAALGRHPVPYREGASIMDAVQDGDIDLSGIGDPRLRLLCEGLLTWRHEDRWGTKEVADWLADRSPRVVRAGPGPRAGTTGEEPAAPPPDAPRFEHAGRVCVHPSELGAEFAADWAAMARRLAKGKERERLCAWLGHFRPTADDDRAAALDALLEALKRKPKPATLIDLVHWLAPRQEPGYRDLPLGMGHLLLFARRAAAGDRECVSVLTELREGRLLPRLATWRGGAELAHVDDRWNRYGERWRAAVARLPQIPELAEDRGGLRAATADGPLLLAQLLQLAVDPATVARPLRMELRDAVRALPAQVPWFLRLAEDTDDPVTLLLTLRLLPLAQEQARRIRLDRENLRQLAAMDTRSRQQRLIRRQLELPVMLGRAAGGALLLFFPHAFVVGVADVYAVAPQSTVLVAWLLSVPSLAGLLAIECWTAWYVGHLYHPRYSVMGVLTRRALPVTRRITVRGWRRYARAGLTAAVALGTVVGTFVLAVWIWPLATVLALLISAALRTRSWHRYRTEAHRNNPLTAQPLGPAAWPGPGSGPGSGADYGAGHGHGEGNGDGTGPGHSDGTGHGDGYGIGTGRGGGHGYGAGRGEGTGHGTGTGDGTGTGAGPFPGVPGARGPSRPPSAPLSPSGSPSGSRPGSRSDSRSGGVA
ncbi:protein kinase domain-containing protein [Streptomyces tauricus]|uniref:protein kinase domain-containing protein n=1 Tax=Streptomyces tauricus TaxID=68274 RepID=UPI0033A5AA8E